MGPVLCIVDIVLVSAVPPHPVQKSSDLALESIPLIPWCAECNPSNLTFLRWDKHFVVFEGDVIHDVQVRLSR